VGTAHPADAAAILRTLDAAANRGREGLRVLEDFARFGLNDAHLTARLKDARHRLSRLLDSLAGDAPLRLRDTPGDVGTSIHNTSEATRESDRDLVVANCKRVQEALRTLEEFGKRLDPDAASRIGELRYESYTLEQALLTTRQANARLAGVRLCLLATTALCRGGIERVVRGALDGGCGMIQLREKSIPDRELLALARQVRDWTRAAGALLIVNDRADISVLADADGVHVGEDDLSVAEARRIVGPDRLVGVSTHSLDQARAGVLAGADYLGVGPVFPSQTKEFETLAGLDYVRQVAAEIALPWFAIGGIDVGNIGEVAAAGGRRMAVSRVVGQAADPAAAARELNQRLQDIS
jgi:thiamine-phosphate pyrophosphorylase